MTANGPISLSSMFFSHSLDFLRKMYMYSTCFRIVLGQNHPRHETTFQTFVIDYIQILESITTVRLFIGYIISKCLSLCAPKVASESSKRHLFVEITALIVSPKTCLAS